MTRSHSQRANLSAQTYPLLYSMALLCAACGSGEQDDDSVIYRVVERARQAKFKADDFVLVKLQVQDSAKDGLFGTCIHVPMLDAAQRTHDCAIGITLPIHVRREKWPRDEDMAAQYLSRAANAVRKHLLDFVHADALTCRAYYLKMQAYLRYGDKRQRETWKGANLFQCPAYQGTSLPDFYFRDGHLLIGDYREWSKHEPEQ